MRSLALAYFLAVCGNALALSTDCDEYLAKGGEQVGELQVDNVRIFSFPASLGNNPLLEVMLTAKNDTVRIDVPVAFKLDGDVAHVSFSVRPDLLELDIEARYSEEPCGPRLHVQLGK